MRLFHLSDTHLGHQQYPRSDPTGLNQREVDIYQAFHAVVDAAVAERPDLVIHAGDLFDGVRPGNRALAQAMDGFLKLSRAGVPTVVIAGNHEHPKLRETGSPMRLFTHLPGIHVAFQGKAESWIIPTRSGPASVHAVPQCQDATALAAEVEGIQLRPGRNILVVHGAVPSLPAFAHAEFNELTLEPAWFRRFDYVALGHYHGCKQVAPNAWYCGAPERVSMAEAGEEKGFLDVALEARAQQEGAAAAGATDAGNSAPNLPGPDAVAAEGLRVRFRPLAGRTYLDLPAIDAGGLDAPAVKAAALSALTRVPLGAVARLRLEGLSPELRGALDVRAIRAAAEGLLHLELRQEWADAGLERAGAAELAPLTQELDTFLASQPMAAADRERLRALAKALWDATDPAAEPGRTPSTLDALADGSGLPGLVGRALEISAAGPTAQAAPAAHPLSEGGHPAQPTAEASATVAAPPPRGGRA